MRNLIPLLIAEECRKSNTSGKFKAYSMFVDTSGFTAMTEKLMKGGIEGAEIIAKTINITYNNDVDLIVISSKEVLENISFYCDFYSDGEIVYTSPEYIFSSEDLWPQSAEAYLMNT